MKKVFALSVILFILITTALAKEYSSDIKAVTLYQSRAKITREASLTVSPGTNEIVLGRLTSTLQQSSLQVEIEGRAILLSATTRINYLSEQKVTQQIKVLQDSLELINNKINWLQNQKTVYQGEERLILENQQLGSEQEGMRIDDLKQLTSFYRERLMEVKKYILDITKNTTKLNTQKNSIQQQLNELNASKNIPTGEVLLTISANSSVRIKIHFSYIATNASWTPVYDIRSESSDDPVKIVYKANVKQNTSLDWKEIQLNISTGTPATNNNRPILYPWFIDFYSPQLKNTAAKRKSAAAPQMQEVYAADKEMYIEEERPAPEYSVSVSSNQMTSEYKIETPQTIPSDGKSHLVCMKEYELQAKYAYHTVPKLNDGAFLLAKIVDYGQYNLLPGKANLFFEGMYVGESSINPHTTSDTLLISLGRDNKINVKRNQLKDFSKKQVVGGNIKVEKGYEILVRNNNTFPVSLEVLDQVPISKKKEIEVTLEEKDGAIYLEDSGKLKWNLKLTPGETKTIRFVFSVKYPKGKNIPGI